MTFFAWEGRDLLLHVRVQPRASRNRLVGVVGDRLKIALCAPPVAGAANEGLRQLLSREFHLAKGQVVVVRGETSREKSLRLMDVDGPAARDWLAARGAVEG